jgi:hypothetical protein
MKERSIKRLCIWMENCHLLTQLRTGMKTRRDFLCKRYTPDWGELLRV